MCSRARYCLLSFVLLASGLLPSSSAAAVFGPEFEYQEDLYLALDGSATASLNVSVPALVALRGVDLDVSPRARIDRARVRAMFEGPGVEVTNVSLYRRNGRRFIYVSINVDNLRRLQAIRPFASSTYRFDRRADVFEFRQVVGSSAGNPIGDVRWKGDEQVAFRVHLPSRIPFHNAPGGIQRGNILQWEQPLSERLKGTPLELQAEMEPESILYTTLLLFGGTVLAAAAAFGLVVWWVLRRKIEKKPGLALADKS